MNARHELRGTMASAGEHAGTEACSKQITTGGRLDILWKTEHHKVLQGRIRDECKANLGS